MPSIQHKSTHIGSREIIPESLTVSNAHFKPKLGRSRSDRAAKLARFTRLVVKAATRKRASKSPWATALTRRPVAELGRGKGSLHALLPPQPAGGASSSRLASRDMGLPTSAPLRAHQHYIRRDGVTRDGGPGQIYDRECDTVDGGAFLGFQKKDTYQFRLIVAPEDSARMAELKPFVRDLMAGIEQDLGTKLDWVAVDHFNTGHPHTHIIIAGHDDRGDDLVMARHYISHGIRHRARELVTLELGPELEFERVVKLAQEVRAERFTSLDRTILKDAVDNVLVVSAAPGNEPGRQALRMGRLQILAQMGLAEEKRTGVWALDVRLEPKLRQMGERGDKMVIMHHVMRAHGIDRPAGDFAIFEGARRDTPVIGRVVEVGLADEMNDRKYLVVDGIDGRIHYAETSKLALHEVPEPDMIVALTGGAKGKIRNAQVQVLSYWQLEEMTTAEAETWLDRTIVSDKRPVVHEHGFGSQVPKVLAAREDWLIANGLATARTPDSITPKPGMLRELHHRGLVRVAEQLSAEFKMPHFPPHEGMRITGEHVRTIDLPTLKIAVIKCCEDFTLVPYRPELQQMRSRSITVGVHDRTVSLTIARGRDLGLPR
jgi:type IV secretory pathway VirD2 relaxase